ncbi:MULTISPECIES: ATP phosphoribosyltransferase [unclassified Arcicella]|uniref:ATP phosphoribosyltransferase n=1 Tax=unclassified Arcicella TaxID=2644986 RepID=UPI00285F8799|nr:MULTISPECIES: ATP phosphoribosyltransferase [unclassified Arcicella]MDR6562524.1 ATP phosphoribosyltransferase [Arcicella sp. BE51]MDR6812611.1 ATP phosphoribosyltransferase [Arcicella sp. BE140]MDR6823923.1 ATP phosphoribosyltransferase [Arcicella sp. BE139]
MTQNLRIAVQKSGRLSEDSLNLFKECGIKFDNGAGKLKATSSNFPAEFLFLRDDDIPGYVEDGVADIGIVGQNVHVESNKNVSEVKLLGFSKCRLSIAIPRGDEYQGIEDLEGKDIATSYPIILGGYLKEHGVTSHIHEISGSVEIAPSIGLAHAVCDIVSSGGTLLSNGLKEVEVIFRSEAIMIGCPTLSAEKQDILNQILFRIDAVQRAKNNKYVVLNTKNENIEAISKLLPGMQSPSIIPLAQAGWSAMSSVINENDFWQNIEKLREAGAEGILVMPIEKMIY